MADPLLLTVAQMRRIEPYFPLSRGIATVDNRLAIDRVTLVIANGLRWRAAVHARASRTGRRSRRGA